MTDSMSQNLLTSVTSGLWTAEDEVALPGGARLPTKMILLDTGGGALALISPLPLSDTLAADVARVGRVEQLVSPALFHHLYLPAAQQLYPDARLCGPPGLGRKNPGLRIDETLEDSARASLGPDVDYVFIEGAPTLGEICIFHRSSRTLVVADLVFNVHEYRGFMTGLLLRATGAHRRLATSRLWRRFVQDRARVRASLERVLAWDFARVVVAHGRVVTEDAHGEIERALAPLLAS